MDAQTFKLILWAVALLIAGALIYHAVARGSSSPKPVSPLPDNLGERTPLPDLSTKRSPTDPSMVKVPAVPTLSGPTSFTIGKAATTSTLTSDVLKPVFGQEITFTVMVDVVPPGVGTPTGLVHFFDGDQSLGSAQMLENGVASIKMANLSTGNHAIRVRYNGDSNFEGSATT